MKNLVAAPQTAEISLAKQQATRVQLTRPDFDNGMKTVSLTLRPRHTALTRPDFDNGMKTDSFQFVNTRNTS